MDVKQDLCITWKYIAILHTSFENMGEPPSAKQGSNKSIFLQDKTDQHKKEKPLDWWILKERPTKGYCCMTFSFKFWAWCLGMRHYILHNFSLELNLFLLVKIYYQYHIFPSLESIKLILFFISKKAILLLKHRFWEPSKIYGIQMPFHFPFSIQLNHLGHTNLIILFLVL